MEKPLNSLVWIWWIPTAYTSSERNAIAPQALIALLKNNRESLPNPNGSGLTCHLKNLPTENPYMADPTALCNL
jgi:hypothetical protein